MRVCRLIPTDTVGFPLPVLTNSHQNSHCLSLNIGFNNVPLFFNIFNVYNMYQKFYPLLLVDIHAHRPVVLKGINRILESCFLCAMIM